jgi:hypothetical protein
MVPGISRVAVVPQVNRRGRIILNLSADVNEAAPNKRRWTHHPKRLERPAAPLQVSVNAARYREAIQEALARPQNFISLNAFEQLQGKLQHASIALPTMRGFMTPLNKVLGRSPATVGLARSSELREVLEQIIPMITLACERPSHITELVSPDHPHYYKFVDLSAVGAGGVILPCTKWIQPTVWRVTLCGGREEPMLTSRHVSAVTSGRAHGSGVVFAPRRRSLVGPAHPRTQTFRSVKEVRACCNRTAREWDRLGLGKLGHRVPDFLDPGLVTRYQVEVLQPVEGRSSDSFPAFRGAPTFHVKVGPLFAFRRSGESHTINFTVTFLLFIVEEKGKAMTCYTALRMQDFGGRLPCSGPVSSGMLE